MQPVLALELSTDGILLHQLSYDGVWRKLASAALSDPFLDKKMLAMRQTARASQGRFFTNQVWLPPEHIISFDVKLTSTEPDEKQIEAENLVRDNHEFSDGEYVVRFGEEDTNGNTKIAAVSKSILQEADRFVSNYGFSCEGFTSSERINGFYQQPQFSISASSKFAPNYAKIGFFVGIGIVVTGIIAGGYWAFSNLDFINDPSLAIEATDGRVLDLDEDPRAPIRPSDIAKVADQSAPEVLASAPSSAFIPKLDTSIVEFETMVEQRVLGSSINIAQSPEIMSSITLVTASARIPSAPTPPMIDSLPSPETSGFPVAAIASLENFDQSGTSDFKAGLKLSRYDYLPSKISDISYQHQADLLPDEGSTVSLVAQLRKYNDSLGLTQVQNSATALAEAARIAEIQLAPTSVVNGSPKIVPFLRDGRNIAELPDDPEPSAVTEYEVLFTRVVTSLTVEELQRIPPRVYERSPDIIPTLRGGEKIVNLVAENTVTEVAAATLGVSVTNDNAAKFRPLSRPPSIEKLAIVNDPELSEFVVSSTKAPRHRREGFSAYVESIADKIAENARVTPTYDDSKRNVNLPTSANVANSATIKNGINLNATTLMGVYGKAGNYKALLRMRGGKYFMLGVGEIIDGWTIIAIDASTVRIRKGGKTNILRLPAEG